MEKPSIEILRRFAVAVVLCGATSTTVAATVHDPAAEFSLADNPNGPWQYGYSTTLHGPLTPFVDTLAFGGIDFVLRNLANTNTPHIGRNFGTADVTFFSTTFRPGELVLHPGPGGEFAVLRFDVPAAGTWQLDALFDMRSFGGTHSTDVHVALNGNPLFDNLVTTFDDQAAFNVALALAPGDHLDFAVGANGSYLGDTTALIASLALQPVPLPAPLGLLAGAVLMLRVRGRRKHPRHQCTPGRAVGHCVAHDC
ncbi:MAG: hypothetical protein KDK06_00625 [Gammaproteobacteria bacterium]|nr:hypothetical protein [Gammaproteobacteria bacterium]